MLTIGISHTVRSLLLSLSHESMVHQMLYDTISLVGCNAILSPEKNIQ